MIHLTRLNNQPLVVNADLIKFIENSPDTVITLITAEKVVVRETVEEVLKRVEAFQQKAGRVIGPRSGVTRLSADAESRGEQPPEKASDH
jgi:flagellar protein FlbD